MDFRVWDRVGIRDKVRDRCGFGFIPFSSSLLELKICPGGKNKGTGLTSLKLPY